MPPRTEITVDWLSVPITDDISPYLLSLSYTDNLTGSADDLTLELEDRAGLWSGDWRPTIGDTAEVTIKADPWISESDTLQTGGMSYDKITTHGPPRTVSLMCASAALTSGLRRRKRTRAWQGRTLLGVAHDIASRAGLALTLDGLDTAPYRRRDQREQSDLEFLEALAKESGRAVKVTDGKIALFSERERERSSPIGTIDLARNAADRRVLSWRFSDDESARYGSCRVSYKSPRTGRTITGTFTDPTRMGGNELEVRHPVETKAEAEEIARGRLRDANRFASTGSLVVMGDPGLVAGVTFDLAGAGPMDGAWIITRAVHRPTNGYEVALDVRRCAENV